MFVHTKIQSFFNWIFNQKPLHSTQKRTIQSNVESPITKTLIVKKSALNLSFTRIILKVISAVCLLFFIFWVWTFFQYYNNQNLKLETKLSTLKKERESYDKLLRIEVIELKKAQAVYRLNLRQNAIELDIVDLSEEERNKALKMLADNERNKILARTKTLQLYREKIKSIDYDIQTIEKELDTINNH